MSDFLPPYIGAAYYPEVWDLSEIPADIAKMRAMGVNLARVGEFAWSRMEPEEGKYDLGWLHEAMDQLARNGIAVMLCTPTATPPAWLTQRYPESLAVLEDGWRVIHGGRRHYCPSSPKYRELSRGITAKLAQDFAHYPNLVAWQVDNEFGGHIMSCYCDTCREQFRGWLREEYGTIANLNASWGTDIWSQTYNDFSQVPLPQRAGARHHPSLNLKYRNFMSDSFVTYAREQADEIRKYSQSPVATNGHPPQNHRVDYEAMFRDMDLVATDNYGHPPDLSTYAMEFDWMRPMKSRPYWLTETSCTRQGVTAGTGYLRAKMWLAYALGGDAIAFWLWRAHWSGIEMEHGSLLYPWGETTEAENEVRQVAGEVKRAEAFLRNTRPAQPGVAIHYSFPSMWTFDYTAPVSNFRYDPIFLDYYRMFINANIHRDLIYPNAEVKDYRTVCSPYLPIIPEKTLAKLRDFVENGGTWILGPLSGYHTKDGTFHRSGALGQVEDFLGLHVRRRFPPTANESSIIDWPGRGSVNRALAWCDAFELGPNCRALATYPDGPGRGLAAVAECSVGKGRALVLGTLPEQGVLGSWIAEICGEALAPGVASTSSGIVSIPRVDNTGKPAGVILLDVKGQGGEVRVSRKAIDLLTGAESPEVLRFKAHDLAVLEFGD